MAQLTEDMQDRQDIADRVFECYRTNDLMRMLVERWLDLTIGPQITVEPRPDWRALGMDDRKEADKWSARVKCDFEALATSPDRWVSANRQYSLTGLVRASGLMRKITGESFVTREFRSSPLGLSTCFQLVNPARVIASRNSLMTTGSRVFQGIEFDRYGAARAYHIQHADPTQKRNFGRKKTQIVPKFNRFGWRQVFHIFDPLMPEYPRGISPYCALLPRIEQRDQLIKTDLDRRILAASIAFVITSDDTPENIAHMMADVERAAAGADGPIEGDAATLDHETKKREFLKELLDSRKKRMAGSVWLQLYDGETMTDVQSNQQIATTENALRDVTGMISNGVGLSYETGTGDFRGINFSAGQLSAGMTEFGTAIERKMHEHHLVELMYRSFLHEWMVRNPGELLNGVPFFGPQNGLNRERYARIEIPGVRRVSADPLKDRKTSALSVATGLEARSNIVAANGGNYSDLIEARTQDAQIVLDSIDQISKAKGLPLSDTDRVQILLRMILTEKVGVDWEEQTDGAISPPTPEAETQ